MTSVEALTGKEFTVLLYIYNTNGVLISSQSKKKQFPYYVNDNSRLTFGGICTVNLTLKSYTYHKKPNYVGNRHYVEGYSTTFNYDISLNDQYIYKQDTVTRFNHIYDWVENDESDTSEKDFDVWRDFIESDTNGVYEGERSMTENSRNGVIDRRIITIFTFTIYLTKKDRVPTYLPVRNDNGVIVRHYSTNVIFRDE